MTEQTDRSDPEGHSTLPDEPPEDNYRWTGEPQDPDAAGMPAEFANEPGDGVPGVRQSDDGAPPPAGESEE
ncbi:MAG TPA: hypothetical protein VEG38_12520 [Acidimicrobiia bacterium]|nr:hypothetical protein [Acidimicrobiia bacterium]